ncbi:Cytochrome c oxidase assembly protein OS=Streptomyces tendae OX=1932 GN=GUR47_29645 PE=4 SV=1 [Streptomyces tendae]
MDHSGHGMTMDLPPFTLGRGLAWSADPFFPIACLLRTGAVQAGASSVWCGAVTGEPVGRTVADVPAC